MLVPSLLLQGSTKVICEASICTNVPVLSAARLVFNSTCAIAAIDAMASPLNPMVFILNKSAALASLEVACLSKQSCASAGLMPDPLSMI